MKIKLKILWTLLILGVIFVACENPTIQNIETEKNEPLSNADLSALVTNTGTLNPNFASNHTTYVIIVPNSTTSITLTGTKSNVNASISENNGRAQNLAVGPNTITLTVTAQNKTTSKDYIFTVTREADAVDDAELVVPLGNNAKLSALNLSEGTLNPDFASDTIEYTVSVPYSSRYITITGTTSDTNTSVNSLNGTAQYLAVGENVLTLTVTAQDETTVKDYVIKVTRAAVSSGGISHSAQVPANYSLVFNDEFEGSGLIDSNKWSYETWGNEIGWGNGEIQQYLVADQDNVYQNDGKLNIVAIKEPVAGYLWDAGERQAHIYNYSSARITSYPEASPLTYGFIEVRAKLPGVGGTWPAIWLAGRDYQWPKGGEIDIMEQWGTDDVIGGNFHTYSSHNPYTELIKHYRPTNPFSTFHNYQLLWTPTKLTVMVDGFEVNTYEKNTSLTGDASINQWPFDTSQSLILNLAIQGKGVIIDDAKIPTKFEIDYVRWYQAD